MLNRLILIQNVCFLQSTAQIPREIGEISTLWYHLKGSALQPSFNSFNYSIRKHELTAETYNILRSAFLTVWAD